MSNKSKVTAPVDHRVKPALSSSQGQVLLESFCPQKAHHIPFKMILFISMKKKKANVEFRLIMWRIPGLLQM